MKAKESDKPILIPIRASFTYNEICLMIEDLHERISNLEKTSNANQSKEVRDG